MTRRAAVLMAGGLWAAVGCDPEPPPVVEAKRVDEPMAQVVELKPPPRPPQTEAAAAELLKDALTAHTGGQPERLEKLKACAYVRTGKSETPGGRTDATWKFHLQWPDRFRMSAEAQLGGGVTHAHTFALSPAGAWRASVLTGSGQVPQEKREKVTLDAEASRTLTSQFHEDCLVFLFPLADPKTVAARAPDESLNGQELIGLHVWTPALDYALLGFDKKTKLLTRVVYSGREALTNVTKEVVATEHQEFDGVKLASKLYVKANGRTLADWYKLTVTTGQPIDPKVFENP
jgi:hypothetical protein